MEFNKKEAYKIYLDIKSLTDATRQWCEENGLKYEDKYMHRLKRYVNNMSIDTDFDTDTDTVTNQYSNDSDRDDDEVFMPSAWNELEQRFYDIDEYCDKYNLPKEQVRSSKLVAHQAKHMIYNIAFNASFKEDTGIDEEFIAEIVRKNFSQGYSPPVFGFSEDSKKTFDRLVYTDVHIGMDVNSDGDPLYDGKWDKEELLLRLEKMVGHVLKRRKSSILYIDDLGDLMDGLGGQTSRKSHELPQNMNDKEAFDLALQFKVSMIDKLVANYDKIICHNITNDNHSSVFGYFVNKAFKEIVELKYPGRIEVINIKRFISHYSAFNHTFVLSHGKDSEALKFGFKPQLDTKQIEKIDQYCKEHRLYNGNYIEFSKGDSHQAIYDDTTSLDFSYYNYPAFSPPSNWVKTNFKNSKSGFNFFVIDKEENIKCSIPFWF